MTIRELIYEAELNNHKSLLLLLDFLVNEKKAVNLTDNESVLALYFMPKHKERLNIMLKEYIEKRREDKTWVCVGLFKEGWNG